MSREWDRREFLKASGAASITTLIAGCTEESAPAITPTRRDTSTPTDRPATPTDRPETPTDRPTETEEETELELAEYLYLLDLETEYHLDPEDDGRIEREYTAYAGGTRTTYTETFSESIYEFYANQTRQYVNNPQFKYGSYVSDQLDNYLIDSIIDEFEAYGRENDHNERQVIEHMMSFVQNLKYTTDIAGTGWNEYPKYPLETLVEQDGDCEDTAILMANLLRNYGYGTKLIYATEDMTAEEAGGHMAVGIKGESDVEGTYYEDDSGDRYYYIETTTAGYAIGETPEWMNRAYLQPVGVHPVPGAVYAKVTDIDGEEITVSGETVNTGPVGTDGIQIQVTLIDADRYITDQAISEYKSVAGFSGDLDTLGSAQQATTELTLEVDEPQAMRLVAQSFVNGSEVSRTESPLRRPH